MLVHEVDCGTVSMRMHKVRINVFCVHERQERIDRLSQQKGGGARQTQLQRPTVLSLPLCSGPGEGREFGGGCRSILRSVIWQKAKSFVAMLNI